MILVFHVTGKNVWKCLGGQSWSESVPWKPYHLQPIPCRTWTNTTLEFQWPNKTCSPYHLTKYFWWLVLFTPTFKYFKSVFFGIIHFSWICFKYCEPWTSVCFGFFTTYPRDPRDPLSGNSPASSHRHWPLEVMTDLKCPMKSRENEGDVCCLHCLTSEKRLFSCSGERILTSMMMSKTFWIYQCNYIRYKVVTSSDASWFISFIHYCWETVDMVCS